MDDNRNGAAAAVRAWFLRHIARPQPAQEFVPQIDGLRFVAIVSVLLYHIQGYVLGKATGAGQAIGFVPQLLAQGHFGVPLFFAVSGYILGRPFLGNRSPSLQRYFTRRFTRLEPPYVISLLVIFALKVSVLGVAFQTLLPNLLASLVYSHGLVYGSHSAVNGVAWSLEIEWQFYLLAPFLFAGILRLSPASRHLGLWLLIGLGGWAYAIDYPSGSRAALSLLRFFGFFMAGAWVAVLDEQRSAPAEGSVRYDALGLAAWIATIAILLDGTRLLAWLPALTALIVLSGIRGRILGRIFGWWPIYCVGAMCYTIYLYHFFVVSALGRIFAGLVGWPASPEMALLAFALFAAPLTLALCVIPYLVIERPFMVWRPGKNRLADAFRRQD